MERENPRSGGLNDELCVIRSITRQEQDHYFENEKSLTDTDQLNALDRGREEAREPVTISGCG